MQGKIMTKIANRSFDKVAWFRYLGMTVTNHNSIQEEFRWRFENSTEENIQTEEK
jgi:hypothetical protein